MICTAMKLVLPTAARSVSSWLPSRALWSGKSTRRGRRRLPDSKDAMALEVKQAFLAPGLQGKAGGASQGFESGCLASAERAQNHYDNMRSARAEEGVLRLLLWDDTLFSDHIPLVPERFSSPLLGRCISKAVGGPCRWKEADDCLLGRGFTQEETEHLTAVCQEPVSLSNAAAGLEELHKRYQRRS